MNPLSTTSSASVLITKKIKKIQTCAVFTFFVGKRRRYNWSLKSKERKSHYQCITIDVVMDVILANKTKPLLWNNHPGYVFIATWCTALTFMEFYQTL